ncbi:acyltransferase [Neisseria weaveri]|uniref:acyltransferase n=1 Tax=Neisseria weaveri TaxID=28091 RepID=UPI0002231D8C|nr:acyltransferase [Neisseria weaveri]EGV35637.1 galactoside O-acetyltransferase [Neisseria weaveri ATCC 51223]
MKISIKQKFFLYLLRSIGVILPPSYSKIVGPIAKAIRYRIAKQISPHLGRNVNIERGGFVLPDTVVGDNSGIGTYCEVTQGLIIGKDVLMGPECLFYTKQHKFNPQTQRLEGYTDIKPITIGDRVWLGRRCIIMGGVTIGEGAIIEAGSVVTKDIPPYCMAAGNPAVVKKHLLDNQTEHQPD